MNEIFYFDFDFDFECQWKSIEWNEAERARKIMMENCKIQ